MAMQSVISKQLNLTDTIILPIACNTVAKIVPQIQLGVYAACAAGGSVKIYKMAGQ
jgi:hypothetical protein